MGGQIKIICSRLPRIRVQPFQYFKLHSYPRAIDDFAANVLPQLTEAYDLIVIDTPPVLGVADAARVGVLADETLVVVRSGKTPERALQNCVERLEDSGVHLSGTVMNDIEPRRYRQMNLGGGYGYY